MQVGRAERSVPGGGLGELGRDPVGRRRRVDLGQALGDARASSAAGSLPCGCSSTGCSATALHSPLTDRPAFRRPARDAPPASRSRPVRSRSGDGPVPVAPQHGPGGRLSAAPAQDAGRRSVCGRLPAGLAWSIPAIPEACCTLRPRSSSSSTSTLAWAARRPTALPRCSTVDVDAAFEARSITAASRGPLRPGQQDTPGSCPAGTPRRESVRGATRYMHTRLEC